VGATVGTRVGRAVGNLVGLLVGVASKVRSLVGKSVGALVLERPNGADGTNKSVGLDDGDDVDSRSGLLVEVGTFVGAAVGLGNGRHPEVSIKACIGHGVFIAAKSTHCKYSSSTAHA